MTISGNCYASNIIFYINFTKKGPSKKLRSCFSKEAKHTYTKITRSKILIQFWQNLFQTETFQSGNFLKSSLAQKFPEIIFRLNLRDNISIWTNLNTCGPTLIRNLSETSKLFICSPFFAIIRVFFGENFGKTLQKVMLQKLEKGWRIFK